MDSPTSPAMADDTGLKIANAIMAAVQDSPAMRRTAFIASLRAYAEFLELHPGVDAPKYLTVNVFVDTREDVTRHARAATWEKEYNDTWFSLVRKFGEDLRVDITASRDTVCRRVVVGKVTIPAREEQVVDKVEWICDEPLLAGVR